ncbi:MAG: selenium-dependent xanthine dehydrogenase [Armatimonadota bacterium]|nr:selenium-dependent xanthine dehydrogenase [Armatimonadota bacterium]MDR7519485.1 selenium-dependent xanthine dehydrogenase [Armatimonadota bacterium]MDR7549050.1 selenium-dependent xanthine dehydrogenase [Armatimonadota bacterium]
MSRRTLQFTLNGRPVSVDVREGASLLDVLREGCGITSVKDGCAPEGSCGACTVIVDGRAVVSCAQPASRFAGKHVTTLEGLSPAAREVWATCFVAAGASQCGFCSPGIVMKAEALLARQPAPTRDEIARALAGNLCRCTGYIKIIDAIQQAAAARRGGPLPAIDRSGRVGSRTARYQGRELALGDKPYVNDMRVPGMLHGAIRWSDHPRARILRIDTSKAEAYPGVVAVVTWKDVPGERRQGLITRDWRQFVAEGETTNYVGDVLAAVAAETRHAAREAAGLIEVAYEVLPPITDPFEALAPGAPEIHEGGNVLSVSTVKRGDADAALARAAHVATETFVTQFVEHAFLEPESALAVPTDDGGLHVYSQGQGVWDDRRQIASLLAISVEKVRVTQVSNGGAFGAKEDLNVQGHAALLAARTGRPVLLTLSRAESIRFHPKRHPMTLTYTVGCDADGRLVAVRARIVGDTGAYASVGDKVLERAAGHACGAYRVPAVDIEATAVYTNNPPAGAMRGFGSHQAQFAMEGMMDILAEKVGLDGWEMRWRNALEVGDLFGTGQRLGPGVGVKRCLLAVRDAYRSAKYAGIACGVKNTGVGNGLKEYGKAILRPEADGTVTLFHSWTEMGQGVHTALQQIACEELGLPADRVHVVVDTLRELDTGQTTASRSTVLGGRAVIEAAKKVKAALDGRRLEDLAGQEFYGEVVVDWTYKPGSGPEGAATHFAYGWAAQVVILDEEGRIAKVVAAHDVGKVINPTLLEGQIEGGIHMGLGHALSEELVVERGVPVTTTLKSLNIIPPAGMPDVECIFVEEYQPEGPYGAKGVGEIALVPTAGAVAGALYAFDGIRRTRLPMKDSPAARAACPKVSVPARAR